MKESFLHFIWKNQYFNKNKLLTLSQRALEIKKVGHQNFVAGPDFKESYIISEGIHWFGSVEIHIKSSDWHKHGHTGDPNYENVILHVVYEYDKPVYDSNDQEIPTLELKGRIKPGLLSRYEALINHQGFVPCADSFQKVRSISRMSMLERVVIERLERKAAVIQSLLDQSLDDWEETAYQCLAQSLGFKVNAEHMLTLAQTVSIKTLLKHSSLFQIEALLFGASGLLNIDFKDEYPQQLKTEYLFLSKKYGIKGKLSFNQWHFSGARPSNFPTIRIAQLAALIHKHQNLFSLFTEFQKPSHLKEAFDLEVSEYWQTHYNFEKPSEKVLGRFTQKNVQHVIINVSILLLVTLSKSRDDNRLLDKAINLLISLPKEQNGVINQWMGLDWNVSSAYDSQGLLELKNSYCALKKCEQCSIGIELMTSSLTN